jgi:hypothetical protein
VSFLSFYINYILHDAVTITYGNLYRYRVEVARTVVILEYHLIIIICVCYTVK